MSARNVINLRSVVEQVKESLELEVGGAVKRELLFSQAQVHGLQLRMHNFELPRLLWLQHQRAHRHHLLLHETEDTRRGASTGRVEQRRRASLWGA